MSADKKSGPAQADQVEQAQADTRQEQTKKPEGKSGKSDEDLPGADGFASAGANEDTYD